MEVTTQSIISLLMTVYSKFYNCKYSFSMMNIEINQIDKLYKKVWEERAWKVIRLYLSMWYYNDLDFSVLNLSEWWLKKFRSKLKKEWIILKCKIDDKFWYKWYLNPYYWNRGKVYKSLYEAFNEINWDKVY